MGKSWDKVLPPMSIWKECLRVLKPGSFGFILCSPRQDLLSHMIIQLGEAGFVTGFTSIYWSYATGFPKSTNAAKMVDVRLGVESEKVAKNPNWRPSKIKSGMAFDGALEHEYVTKHKSGYPNDHLELETWDAEQADEYYLTKPTSEEAKTLDGAYLGFQPKPAVEVVLVVMKPLSEKNYISQAMKDQKGVTWLDTGRIPTKNGDADYNPGGGMGFDSLKDGWDRPWMNDPAYVAQKQAESAERYEQTKDLGRFPANLLVSDRVLDTGSKSKRTLRAPDDGGTGNTLIFSHNKYEERGFEDSGDFSRYYDLDYWFHERIMQYMPETFPFLIVPKPGVTEKNLGLSTKSEPTNRGSGVLVNESTERLGQKERQYGNFHPTVKPIKIGCYLAMIGTKKGATVLDPFMGSGTFGLSALLTDRKFVGVEMDTGYYDIANQRLAALSAYKQQNFVPVSYYHKKSIALEMFF